MKSGKLDLQTATDIVLFRIYFSGTVLIQQVQSKQQIHNSINLILIGSFSEHQRTLKQFNNSQPQLQNVVLLTKLQNALSFVSYKQLQSLMQFENGTKRPEFKQTEIFSHICNYFLLLEQQENVLQAYREAITTRTDFHPLSLFNYVSRGEGFITRKHIIMLLEENRFAKNQDEVKIVFGLYGYKQKMDFVGFLNYIYPSCIEPLKYISTVGLKKYSGIPIEEGVNEQIICLLVLLLIKQIEYIQELQTYKQQNFPRLTKNQIKKLIKLIKRKGESKSYYEIQSQNVITFNEMRICLRKAKNVQENKINSICRKLSMSKDNFINLEQIEFWLKSWTRIKGEDCPEKQPKTLMEDFETCILR